MFESPVPGREFVLFLYQAVETVSNEEFDLLSKQFMIQDCSYALCVGHQCENWHDSIDWTVVMAEVDFGIELPTIMTSGHAEEPLDETVDYLISLTRYADDFPDFLVIFVLGGDEALAEQIRSTVVTGIMETQNE